MCAVIRGVAFDFDGTLVNSNSIKRDGFYATTRDFPGGDQVLCDIFSAVDPGDRYEIFDRFADVTGISAERKIALVKRYSEYCESRIAMCPEMPGATVAMEALVAQEMPIFVNSATPEKDLNVIVQKRHFWSLLTGVFGGPTTKGQNLHRILTTTGLQPQELAVVGDGINDCEAAEEVGCHFIPVFDFPGRAGALMPHLTDLALLSETIVRLSDTCRKRYLAQTSPNLDGKKLL